MCSSRSSTVQWGGSGWKDVASGVDGRMLKDPESAPCERLSMSRPIWADELKKTWRRVRNNVTLINFNLEISTYLGLWALRRLRGLLA